MRSAIKSERTKLRRAIVVGGGRAGLAATLELVANDVPVLLIAEAPSFQSAGVRDREGFNAAAGQRDSLAAHVEDTRARACGLVSEAALTRLAQRAPLVSDWLVALGVPFTREPSGALSRAQLVGSSYARTLHVGANTGRYIISALDALVRAQEARPARDERGISVPGEKLVRRLNYWRFVALVFDDHQNVIGVLAQDTRTLTFKAFPGDGVVFAAAGYAGQYAGAAASPTGAALGTLLEQGAVLSNLEFVQHHPLVVARGGASLALPQILLAHGGRVVSRGKSEQHLDLTMLDPEHVARLAQSLGAPLMKILAVDLTRETVPVERRPLRGLGGLWVDTDPALGGDGFSVREHATSLPGLYACGSAAADYHGAQALAGNLACGDVVGGQLGARGVVCFRQAQEKSAFELPVSLFEKPASAADSEFEAKLKREPKDKSRGPHQLLAALRVSMMRYAGTSQSRSGLEKLLKTVVALEDEVQGASVRGPDTGLNQDALLLASLPSTLCLARALVTSALAREESRGEHRRSDFEDESEGLARASLLKSGADGEHEVITSFEYASLGETVRVGK